MNAATPEYRAPQQCPVCGHGLHVTRLSCDHCDSTLAGDFAGCQFCGLNQADSDLLAVFLTSRGNLREVARHLGVSAPTARARYDEVLDRLGLKPLAVAAETSATASATEADPPSSDADRLAALQALARGEIDVEVARSSLLN